MAPWSMHSTYHLVVVAVDLASLRAAKNVSCDVALLSALQHSKHLASVGAH